MSAEQQPTLKTVIVRIPWETASVLSSLIHCAIGGDFTSNRPRILLEQLQEQLDQYEIPHDEFQVRWEGHIEMQKRRGRKA